MTDAAERRDASLPEYKCGRCNASGVRLWRQYQTFLNHIELLCVECGRADQKMPGHQIKQTESERGDDSIGWLVPAVPTIENDTYWGYTSVPQDRVEWWYSLPIEVVEITIEKSPRCHWHSNCVPGRGSGVMRVVRHENDRTVFECLNCGHSGYVPVGHSFGVCFRSPLHERREG